MKKFINCAVTVYFDYESEADIDVFKSILQVKNVQFTFNIQPEYYIDNIFYVTNVKDTLYFENKNIKKQFLDIDSLVNYLESYL